MNLVSLSYRLAAGVVIGLALFAACAHAQLMAGSAFSPLVLPVALLVGFALAPRPDQPRDADPGPMWLRAVAAVVLAVVVAAIGYGALATPSRHWDGTVAWDVKALFLAREPSLTQDFFAHRSVFCHSRDYPMLQPICIAAGDRLLGNGMGRLLFPLLFVTLVTLVTAVVRLRSPRGWIGPACALAVGVTPILANDSSGAADSGYADAFLATAMTGVAAALVLGHRSVLAASVFVAVLIKPEGLVYGALPAAVLWCCRERAMLRAALAGWLLAAAVWIPFKHQLLHALPRIDPENAWIWWGVLAAVGALVLGTDWLLRSCSPRRRTLLAMLMVPLVLGSLPLLSLALDTNTGTIGEYLADGTRPFRRLLQLPTLLGGFLDHAIAKTRFLATYLLWLALLGTFFANRKKLPHTSLSVFVLLGTATIFAPFFLSPEDELDHLIRASMPRVILHWLGAVWICSGIWLGHVLKPRAGSR